jgi:hypothetical protein
MCIISVQNVSHFEGSRNCRMGKSIWIIKFAETLLLHYLILFLAPLLYIHATSRSLAFTHALQCATQTHARKRHVFRHVNCKLEIFKFRVFIPTTSFLLLAILSSDNDHFMNQWLPSNERAMSMYCQAWHGHSQVIKRWIQYGPVFVDRFLSSE